jgi:hypothetical protein
MFGWDAYLTRLSGKFICYISHDGYIELTARDEQMLRHSFRRLEPWGAKIVPND